MSEELKDLGRALVHNLLTGLGGAGRRAAASALKSGLKDGKKILTEADRRVKSALERLDGMIGSTGEDEDDAPRRKR